MDGQSQRDRRPIKFRRGRPANGARKLTLFDKVKLALLHIGLYVCTALFLFGLAKLYSMTLSASKSRFSIPKGSTKTTAKALQQIIGR